MGLRTICTLVGVLILFGCLPNTPSIRLQSVPEMKMIYSGQRYVLGKLPDPDAPHGILSLGWNHYKYKEIQQPFKQYLERKLAEISNNLSKKLITINIIEYRRMANYMWLWFEFLDQEGKVLTRGSVNGYWIGTGQPSMDEASNAGFDAIDRLVDYLSGKLTPDQIGFVKG